MKRFAIAALAATTLFTSPASAADGSFYVGIEGGLLFARDESVDASYETSGGGPVLLSVSPMATSTLDSFYGLDDKTGRDLGLTGGYDFGLVRTELELSNKRAGHDSYNFFLAGFFGGDTDSFVAHGNPRVNSAMLNVLLDAPVAPGLTLFAGPGIGLAKVKMNLRFDDNDPNYGDMTELDRTISDSSIAFQAVAGARFAVSPQLELGAKYRYFEASKINDQFDADAPFCDTTCGLGTRFRSHSVLATLTYNFAAPIAPAPAPVVEPAPAPEAAPATQTCYGGSVILATDACPMPPAPTPERG